MAPKGEPKRRAKLSNPRGDTGKISNNIEPIRGNLNEHIYIYIEINPFVFEPQTNLAASIDIIVCQEFWQKVK